jgi:hypothetical protein
MSYFIILTAAKDNDRTLWIFTDYVQRTSNDIHMIVSSTNDGSIVSNCLCLPEDIEDHVARGISKDSVFIFNHSQASRVIKN